MTKLVNDIADREERSSARYLKAIDKVLTKSNAERQRLYKRHMAEQGKKRIQVYVYAKHEGICRAVPGINNVLETFVKLLEREKCPPEFCDDIKTLFKFFGHGR
jgi:hypothetical protein